MPIYGRRRIYLNLHHSVAVVIIIKSLNMVTIAINNCNICTRFTPILRQIMMHHRFATNVCLFICNEKISDNHGRCVYASGIVHKSIQLIRCHPCTLHIHNARLFWIIIRLCINTANNCHKLYKLSRNDDKRYMLLVNPHENAINSKYWHTIRFHHTLSLSVRCLSAASLVLIS